MKKKTLFLASTIALGMLTLAVVSGCTVNRAHDPQDAEVAKDAAADATPTVEELAETVADLVEREITLREAERVTPAPAPVVEPEPIPEPEPVVVDLVAGTPLEITLDETVSSETNLVGDPVRATLAAPLVSTGITILESGAIVSGEVVEVVPPKKFGGTSMLAVRFDEVSTSVDSSLPIEAFLFVEGKPQKKKDTATIAGAAAGGAVLGRILGSDDKGESTAIGAVLGAAIGTAVAAKNAADPALLEAGTPVVLNLEQSVPVDALVEEGEIVAILTR